MNKTNDRISPDVIAVDIVNYLPYCLAVALQLEK